MAKRALVICTANICRSPVVERLLRRELDGAVDADGDQWVVSSAGTAEVWPELDPHTVSAASTVGIDLTGHQRRTLNDEILGNDGRDLILTMTREQLRHVAAINPAAWPRTFTLLELARRAGASEPPREGESVAAWLRRLAADRRAADLMRPDPSDDIADPYGRSANDHTAMVNQVHEAVTQLVRHGPWKPAT